jgi:hypothetical protein
MEGKEHFLNSSTFTYLWVMGVSVWGGLVDYFEKREAKKESFSLGKLFAHLLSASFAGLMTFYLCQYGNVPEPLTGVLCGVAAHMGTPALLKMKIIQSFLEKGKVD